MITAVVSKKGGVGKTTTAVNLAAALAASGQRVLLIDLDPNAGASLSLGLDKAALSPGAAELLLRGQTQPLARVVRPGLRIFPASIDLRTAELELNALRRKEVVLAQALAPLRATYDWIFLDCPASLGLLTRNALVAADGYLIPASPNFLATEGLEQLLEMVERLSYRNSTQTTFLGIVLTLVDRRLRSSRDQATAIRERFGNQVFGVEIRANTCLAEAPAFGQTIFEFQPKATGALAYQLLAEEFQLRWSQLRRDPAKNK